MAKRVILNIFLVMFVASCSALFYPVDEDQDNIRIHFSNTHFGNTGSTTIYANDIVRFKYSRNYGRYNQNKVGKSSGAYIEVRALLDQIDFFELRATCRRAVEGDANFMMSLPDGSDTFITLVENGSFTSIAKGCGFEGWVATQEYVDSWNLLHQRIEEIVEAAAR